MKEMLIRAGRTFLQAAVGYVVVYGTTVIQSGESADLKAAITGLCVSAVAAGLAAVMNLPKKEATDEEVQGN